MHFVILMYLGVSHECLTFDEPMPRGRPRGHPLSIELRRRSSSGLGFDLMLVTTSGWATRLASESSRFKRIVVW